VTTKNFIDKVAQLDGYKFNDLINDLLLRGSKSLLAKISNRVRETNILGSGKSYNYSTKPMLVGRKSFLPNKQYAFDTVAKQAKDKDSPIHWVTIEKNGMNYRLIVLPGGYAMLRKLEKNLNTKKNYSRSTEMWQGFGIKKEENRKITLGGTTMVSQDRIDWNSERDKDNIIAPNDKEIKELTEYMSKNIKEFIRAALGS